MMYFAYVLQSLSDKMFYVGFTKDLGNRLELHNKGQVKSTQNRRPMKLIYFEVCFNQQDATHREKHLKSSYGKQYIKNRLKNYLASEI